VMPLSLAELLVILAIVSLMTLECGLAIRSRSWVQIYRPTLFVAVVLAFYVLVGPLRAILAAGETANFVGTSGTFYRGLDHRGFLFWGWLGALVFYASTLIGFHGWLPQLHPRRLMVHADLLRIVRWGRVLCWVGISMYVLVNGSRVINLLNPMAPQNFDRVWLGFGGFNFGPFQNYFQLGINFLIPGIVIQFAVWLRQRKNLWVVASWSVIASLIFLSETFRYRILLLIVPLLLLYLFYYKRRPRLVLLLAFMVIFVGLNGLVGLSRTHLRGLDFTKVAGYRPVEIIASSFEEAGVFFTSSAVLDSVPGKMPFVGLRPFAAAALQPFPRQLLPAKPTGAYANDLRETIYGTAYSFTAYLNFAEYYIVAGWTSLVVLSVSFGCLLRRLWTWFLWRQYEPLAQAVYLLNASYLYVVISRGYLAQVLMLYSFTVIPIFFAYYVLSEDVA
jgi:hypothetical protein